MPKLHRHPISNLTKLIPPYKPAFPFFPAFVPFLFLFLCGCRHTEPFFPIGIYGAHDTNAFNAVRNAGFNTVVSFATPEKLDQARSLGLKLLSPIGSDISSDLNIPKTQSLIDSSDQHPALLAYYLVDEPDLHLIPPDRVRRVHRYFKSYPARKPTALILYNAFNAGDYTGITDIFMIDRYPIPWLPLADFDLHIRLAACSVDPKTPLYTVIQAFDWEVHKQLLPTESGFRPPTKEEIRCMVYLSLSYGSDGIFFYTYKSGGWFIEDDPELWSGLQSINYEIMRLKPLFLADPVYLAINYEFLPYEDRLNEALSPAIRMQTLEVKKGNTFVDEGRYLLAVNTTGKPMKLKWRLGDKREGKISSAVVLDEFRMLSLNGGWFEDDFKAFATHVYGPF